MGAVNVRFNGHILGTQTTKANSQNENDSTSIWGRLLSIPTKVSSYIQEGWSSIKESAKQHWMNFKEIFTPIVIRSATVIGIAVGIAFVLSALVGSPVPMIAMGASAGLGYAINRELTNWNNSSSADSSQTHIQTSGSA